MIEKIDIKMTDHDSIVKIITLLEVVQKDITEIKSGTAIQLANHEKRIFEIEKTKGNQTVLLSIGIGILSVLSGVLFYHIQQPVPKSSADKTTIIYQPDPSGHSSERTDTIYDSSNNFRNK